METYVRPSVPVSSHRCSQDFNYNNMMSSLRNLDLSPRNQERFSRNNDLGGIYALHYSCFSPKPQCVDQGNSVRGFTQARSNDQNVYHNQEFTETRGNGQNGYGSQEFAGRTNPQGGVVSMAMRNEQLMFLQNAVVVELAQCMRILNGVLRRALPQLEAKMAVPRDGQQTPNRDSGSAQGSPGPTISTRIFVGGLPSTVTESDLKTYFGQFGTITNAEVKYDHFTQRTRGFGFITFDSEKAVDKVLLRTSFHELNGKMVEVKRAFPKDIYRKSIRGQLGGINYGLRKVSNLLGACTQAASPSQAGGSGSA